MAMCGRCKKLKRLITKTLCRVCRDYVRAWNQQKYDADPVAGRARAHAYVEQHREHYRVLTREYVARAGGYGKRMAAWRAANPAKAHADWRATARLRRARKLGAATTLTPQEWEAILEAAGRACIYCGSRKQITQDHLIPLSRGGQHTAENVAPACWPCNASKHNKLMHEFLEVA